MKKILVLSTIIACGALSALSACAGGRGGNARPADPGTVAGAVSNARNNMELNERERSLVEIAAHEAKGDVVRLEAAIGRGLDGGLTVGQIKEALTQLYAYTGFPRSLNALGVLQQVVEARTAAGDAPAAGEEFVLPEGFDALKRGTEVQRRLVGGRPYVNRFAPRIDYYLKAHLFGDVFASTVLSEPDREIVTLSAISTLEGCDAQLRAHVAGALNMGVRWEQIEALPSVLEERTGSLEAWRLRRAIAAVAGRPFDEGRPVDFAVWPQGEPNTAYARYFTGNSYLAPMEGEAGGPTNVTFEPRCRNNWHIHHDCVQVLVCVAGRGWYQEEGKEAVCLTPGSVVAVPAGVKHWHGAAKDNWFQHLAYTTRVGADASNEWLEPVTDALYDSLE